MEKASGAEVEPEDEMQIGVAEIVHLLKESDLKQAEEKEKKNHRLEETKVIRRHISIVKRKIHTRIGIETTGIGF